jgi:hypothetical protein
MARFLATLRKLRECGLEIELSRDILHSLTQKAARKMWPSLASASQFNSGCHSLTTRRTAARLLKN